MLDVVCVRVRACVCLFQCGQDEVCMHLTNYAINKHSADFVRDDDSGSKR